MRLFEGTPFDVQPKCDHCQKLESECRCSAQQKARLAPHKQIATLSIEKRKKGKVVTVVNGLSGVANDLPGLLTLLKNTCGAGGTIEQDSIEVQGEHIAKIRTQLEKLGYRVSSK
jgi:translation initiation factor 1